MEIKMRERGAMSASGGFVVTDLIMLEGGRYNERFLRSLKIGKITHNTIDRLTDELIQTNGKTFRPGSIANLSSPLITLESEIDRDRDRLEIASGFETKRFCWILKIKEVEVAAGHKPKTYTVTGYTDRLEFSKLSKSIPGNLEFYINAILEIGEKRKNNLQLFTELNTNSSTKDLYLIRPSDVIAKHAFLNISTGSNNRSSYHGDKLQGKTFKTSSRSNAIASNYAAKSLIGLHKSRMEAEVSRTFSDMGDDDDYTNSFLGRHSSRRSMGRSSEIEAEYEAARTTLNDKYAEDYEFIQLLKDEARNTHRVGSFTFRQLLKFVPDIEDYISLSLVRKDMQSIRGRNGDSNDRMGNLDGEEWGYPTQEELIATEVANAFSTIALSTFISNIDIMFTLVEDELDEVSWDFAIGYEDNHGEQEGSVMFFDEIPEELEEEFIDKLGYTMIDSVLNAYKNFGYEIFISVQYNMNREIFIRVAIDDDEAIEFCTPIFCDSITSSVISNRERSGVKLGEGITELYKQVYQGARR